MISVKNWPNYFMEIAQLVSIRSKDPRKQVGAVIVDTNNRILSTGYNGFPKGVFEHSHRWKKENKNLYVIHAEINALVHSRCDLTGSKIYSTLFPCLECAKAIIASGIVEVYYQEYKSKYEDSKALLIESGVGLHFIRKEDDEESS